MKLRMAIAGVLMLLGLLVGGPWGVAAVVGLGLAWLALVYMLVLTSALLDSYRRHVPPGR